MATLAAAPTTRRRGRRRRRGAAWRVAAMPAKASSVAVSAAGVALAPEREVAVGRARPEQVLGLAAVLPELGRLPELVAQLRAVGVLRLPAHEPRPGLEQRLVDDLDLLVALAGLVPRARRT